MKTRKIAVILIAVGVIALFVPFVPQTSASGSFFGGHYALSADVSPTYYLFHCGSFINSHVAASLGSGFSGFYELQKGYTFSCNYNTG